LVEPTLGAISRFILVHPKRQSMTDCHCMERLSSVAASPGADSAFTVGVIWRFGGLALWWFGALVVWRFGGFAPRRIPRNHYWLTKPRYSPRSIRSLIIHQARECYVIGTEYGVYSTVPRGLDGPTLRSHRISATCSCF
jgi:hypothetical protein